MKKFWLLTAVLFLSIGLSLGCSHKKAAVKASIPHRQDGPTGEHAAKDQRPSSSPSLAEDDRMTVPPPTKLDSPAATASAPPPPDESFPSPIMVGSSGGGGKARPAAHRGTVSGVRTDVASAKLDSALSPGEQIQQILDGLPQGQIVFNPPPEMLLGKQYRLEVRISQDLQEDLSKNLVGLGVPQTDHIQVSQSMKVALSGDPYFKIASLNGEEQLIAAHGFTQWAWDILPQESGNFQLHLAVRRVIHVPGAGEKTMDYPVIDRFIVVKITPMFWLQRFLGTYWQWVIGTILLPIAGWLAKKKFAGGGGGKEPPGNDHAASQPRAA